MRSGLTAIFVLLANRRRPNQLGWGLLLVAMSLASLPTAASGQLQEPAGQIVADGHYAMNGKMAVASPLEQKVKAAYLYNFSRYFDWPSKTFTDPAAPFVIGVLGQDPLGSQLDKLAQKKSVKNRKIVIRRLATPERMEPCQLLFVTRSVSTEQLQLILQKTETLPVLVVSENRFPKPGPSVHLFVDQSDTVGFEIDINVVNAKKLHVSAKLLKLARVPKAPTQ